MERLQYIRSQEKEYHDHCYDEYKLFEAGSWMHKPVKTVLDIFELIEKRDSLQVLDLGCGPGRNSIPLAQAIKHKKGKVVGVDLLDSAVTKLQLYAEEYGVAPYIEAVKSDIGSFAIQEDTYDYIIAVSSLEHLATENEFDHALSCMIEGTKAGGINCFIISTNVKEVLVSSNKELEPLYELNFATDALVEKLQRYYHGWALLKHTIKPYQTKITRDNQPVMLSGDVVTWAVQKY